MTEEDLQPINDLLRQARAGSDQAAREIVDRFGPRILNVVRCRLDKRLRSKFDSMDFVQSVWASFFEIPPEKYDFKESGELIALLEQMARNKVIEEERRRLDGKKRNVQCETLIAKPNDIRESDVKGRGAQTPSQVAMAEEAWQRALEGDSRQQTIMKSIRGGLTTKEIALQLGVSVKTVRRVVCRLRARLSG
jgi:RNA polymerase sigma factor (sigma-70 family)